jgi:Ca-activated chloride channel family protein
MTKRLVLAAAVTLALASPAGAQEIATDRVEAIMLAGGRDALPIHEEKLTVEIDGEYATATLVQTYLNHTAARIEGDYKLRPGSGSHVDGFAYWNGEQKIVGEVFERQTAHEVYNQVTARKRDPGLLEADGEGAFRFKVFPLEPHENKRVEVRWTKWLERHAQTVRFRAPVTSRDAEIVVQIAGPVKNVRSSTHRSRIEQLDHRVRLRAQNAQTGPGGPGEIDLDWDLDEAAWTPEVYIQRGAGRDEGWFALALAAPKLPDDTVIAKDMTIVIDHSGSMEGDKMEHARLAAADMIRVLNPNDRVNVISFSDEVDPLFRMPHALDPQTRQDAIAFVSRLHATGGTDIALALKTAVAAQDRKSDRPRVVVFLTDGQSDAAQAAAVQTGDVRLFTLGLGADVNRPLLQRLAAEKRGRFVFIEDARAIEREVGRLAASISKPLLVDISIDIAGANPTRVYPRTLPDLFAEDELRVSGRMRGAGPVEFVIRGKLAGKPVEFTRAVDLDRAPNRPWTAALWAQSRIDHLLEEISLDGTKQELKDEVLELALAHNVVTPYSAFLAIPESELGTAHDTVMAARERKRKVQLASDQLAADPRAPDPSAPAPAPSASASADSPPPGEAIVITGTAPIVSRELTAAAPVTVMSAEDLESPRRAKEDVASADDDDGEAPAKPRSAAAVQSGHHGCAGCATGSGNGAASLLLVGLTALVLRRRRGAARPV